MKVTPGDVYATAVCLWREARGEGETGMAAVASVIYNRCRQRGMTATAVVMEPWQFSSMTAIGDPQLSLYAPPADPYWMTAQVLALAALRGTAADATHGATMYYADSLKEFPKSWGNPSAYTFTVKIGRHNFYIENRETPMKRV